MLLRSVWLLEILTDVLPLGSTGAEYEKMVPNDDSSPRNPAPVFGKKAGIQCDSNFLKPIRSGLSSKFL